MLVNSFGRVFNGRLAAFALCFLFFNSPVHANKAELDLDEIESFLEKDDRQRQEKRDRKRPQKRRRRKAKPQSLKSISDLANLAPFADVAVIQRRYLEKTGRFEAFIGATSLMNEAFFNNFGAVGKLGYYFSEKWGVEGSFFFLTSAQKDVTKSLEAQGIITESLVSPKSFYGLDLKWVPIYGKMAFFDSRIVPFDLYFSLGAGLTQIEQQGQEGSSTTFKVGTGQVFAIRRSFVFRWDFSWHFFTPTASDSASSEGRTNNLFLLLGVSFLFPDARVR